MSCAISVCGQSAVWHTETDGVREREREKERERERALRKPLKISTAI
jgi:hypothetical protein